VLIADAEAIQLGDQTVSAAYAGAVRVWPLPPVDWDPAQLVGLRVWLDASQLAAADGAGITEWPNLASGGSAGTIVAAPPPTVRAAALNNRPVVRFRANEGRLRMTGTGVHLEYTVCYVARMAAPSIGRILCGNFSTATGTPNMLFGWWDAYEDLAFVGSAGFYFEFLTPDRRQPQSTSWKLYSGDGSVSEYGPPGTPYLPRLFLDGAYLSGTMDASQRFDGWEGTLNLSGYKTENAEETCDCEVAELVMYNRKLPDAERQQVEGYLRDKWLPV
jgi:hypothetical protein